MRLLLAVLCAFMIALGQIFWKLGMEKTPFGFSLEVLGQFFLNRYIITGILLYFTETFLWFWILAREQVGKIYPVLSLSYVFAVLLAKLILKEKVLLILIFYQTQADYMH